MSLLHDFYLGKTENLPLPDSPPEKLFGIELSRTDERGGHFTPTAKLTINRALRTSHVLRDVADADIKTLLLLVTFLRSDGRCEVSLPEAATALGISTAEARKRLDRLLRVQFHDQPVASEFRRDSGLNSYVLSPAVVDMQELLSSKSTPEPTASTSLREEIVARSRKNHANPRSEVEAIIAQQLGHKTTPEPPIDTSTPEGAVRWRMVEIGLTREQIDTLIASFPLDKITRQIDWLPHRRPKDAVRLLMSAIQHDYEPPAFLRLQHDIEAANSREAGTGGVQ